MAITWIPALDQVQNVVGNAVAGGDLDEDTYYIRIAAASYSGYRHTNPPMLRGKASSEILVITSAVNKSIELLWDAVAGAAAYSIYVTKDPSNYYANANPNATMFQTANTSYTITSLSGLNYIHDTFAIPDTAITPNNMPKDLGEGYVRVEGAVGSIDLDDIAAVIPADFLSWDGAHFIVKGSVWIMDSVTGTMSLSEKRISTWHGQWNIHPASALIADYYRCIIDCFHWSFSVETYNCEFQHCVFWAQSDYGAYRVLYGWDLYLYIDSSFIDGGGNAVHDMYFVVSSNTSLSNWEIFGGTNIKGDNLSLSNSTMTGPLRLSYNTMDTDSIEIRECVIGTSWISGVTFHHRFASSWTAAPFKTRDCVYSSTSDNIPQIAWTTPGAYDNSVEIFNSISVHVIEEDGGPIENARVVLENCNGDEQFNILTDGTGNMGPEDIMRALVEHADGGGVGDQTVTEFGPFTLTITKPGFRTYTSVMDITSKQELTVALKPVTEFIEVPIQATIESPNINIQVGTDPIEVEIR
jgi:hypothetical protein